MQALDVCARRDYDSIYVFSTRFCGAYEYSRLDYDICQGLVEILCGFLSIMAGVGLDKLRFLCYTGKGCYEDAHLIIRTGI